MCLYWGEKNTFTATCRDFRPLLGGSSQLGSDSKPCLVSPLSRVVPLLNGLNDFVNRGLLGTEPNWG